MAVVKTLIIKGEDNLDSTIAGVERLDDSLDKVEGSSQKADSALKQVGDNSGAIALLDALTGGWATRIRDAAEASKLLNLNLKATRGALIATGIGAFVVALGTIVAYWDDIVNWITDANEELEAQKKLNDEINRQLERRNRLEQDSARFVDNATKEAILRARIRGASEEEITAIQRKGLEDRIADLTELSREANAILERSTNADTETYEKAFQAQQEIFNKLAEARSDLANFDLTQRAEAAEDDRKQEELVLPTLGLTVPELEIAFETETSLLQAQLTARRNLEESEADARRRIAEEEAEAKILLQENVAQAFMAASGLIGRETAAGKALAVAATLINTYSAIAGQLRAFAGIPIPGYAIAQAIATGLVGFEQVRNILSVDVPGGGAAPGGGVPSRPPAFNVVDSSADNQLNTALLEQSNEPVQAFVVEGEVSSAEELRRGKIAASSIG